MVEGWPSQAARSNGRNGDVEHPTTIAGSSSATLGGRTRHRRVRTAAWGTAPSSCTSRIWTLFSWRATDGAIVLRRQVIFTDP